MLNNKSYLSFDLQPNKSIVVNTSLDKSQDIEIKLAHIEVGFFNTANNKLERLTIFPVNYLNKEFTSKFDIKIDQGKFDVFVKNLITQVISTYSHKLINNDKLLINITIFNELTDQFFDNSLISVTYF